MYHVLGTDRQQYGPADEATLRSWIVAGRVGADSLSFKTGETGWIPLRDRPEVADVLAAQTAAPLAPPPLSRGYVPVTPESPKDWLAALLLSVFLGWAGVDRFYIGHIGLGIAKLITFGGCGIWWLIDVILISVGSVRDSQGRPLARYQ